MSMLNEIIQMSENEIASLHDFSCDIDEMRNDMRNEKLRAMVSILLRECLCDAEVIALATEMECIVDEIKKFINNKHKIIESYNNVI